jgi:hypothetical protein
MIPADININKYNMDSIIELIINTSLMIILLSNMDEITSLYKIHPLIAR